MSAPPESDADTSSHSETAETTRATTSLLEHRVAFYETDAMKIVHHANYLHFFERARVLWLEEHDRPYTDYVDLDLHFAVTGAHIDYHRSANFNDLLRVTVWLEWVRGASMRMAYRVERETELIATGFTEHAAVNSKGRVRRIPKSDRLRLAQNSCESA